MKKKSTKKLSKGQLKKISGGGIICVQTVCYDNTCGGLDKSKDYCGIKTNGSTVGVAASVSSSAAKIGPVASAKIVKIK